MKLSNFGIRAVFCLCLAPAGTSHASIIMTFTESGPNVIATASGTANTAGLTVFGTGVNAYLNPTFAEATVGTLGATLGTIYTSLAGPANIGPGSAIFASSGAGDRVGVFAFLTWLILPTGYVSGNPLSGSATWNGQTFATLGLTPGTYTYTWGSGANADSLQLNIGVAAVPEPGSLMLSGVGLVAGLGVRRFRLRKRASAETLPVN